MPVVRPIVLGLLALGSAAITAASAAYFDGVEEAPFVIEKLPLPHEALWLGALRVHVVAAAFALPACLALLSRRLLQRWPAAHRWLGRAAGVALLGALVPSGAYLAFFATGGWPSTAGFLASGAVVAVAAVRGVAAARARRVAQHRRWALHVVAQLAVAVVSRAMLFGLDAVGADPERAYVASLWLPVLACAGAVEFITRSPTGRRVHVPSPPLAPPAVVAVGLRR